MFWPFYLIASLVWARTSWTANAEAFRIVFYLKGATLLFGLISLWIECLGSTFGPEDIPENVHGDGHVESPLLTANLFSICTFGWMSTLMKKGAQTFITEEDLPSLVPQDESANLGKRLRAATKKRYVVSCRCRSLRTQDSCLFRFLQTSKSLILALFAAYGGPYALAGALKLTQDCLAFLQPQLLRWLLAYIADYQAARPDGIAQQGAPSPIQGFAITVIMFAAAVAQTVILNQVLLNAGVLRLGV